MLEASPVQQIPPDVAASASKVPSITNTDMKFGSKKVKSFGQKINQLQSEKIKKKYNKLKSINNALMGRDENLENVVGSDNALKQHQPVSDQQRLVTSTIDSNTSAFPVRPMEDVYGGYGTARSDYYYQYPQVIPKSDSRNTYLPIAQGIHQQPTSPSYGVIQPKRSHPSKTSLQHPQSKAKMHANQVSGRQESKKSLMAAWPPLNATHSPLPKPTQSPNLSALAAPQLDQQPPGSPRFPGQSDKDVKSSLTDINSEYTADNTSSYKISKRNRKGGKHSSKHKKSKRKR